MLKKTINFVNHHLIVSVVIFIALLSFVIPISYVIGSSMHEKYKEEKELSSKDYNCKDFIDWVDSQELYQAVRKWYNKDRYNLDYDLDGTACEEYEFGQGKTFKEQGWSLMP